MIRILLADDHAILRRGLAEIIAEAGDMQVCAEAETGAQAVKPGARMPSFERIDGESLSALAAYLEHLK